MNTTTDGRAGDSTTTTEYTGVRPAQTPTASRRAPVAARRAATGGPSSAYPVAEEGGKTPAGGSTAADSELSVGQHAVAVAMSEDRGPDSLDAHVRKLMADLGLRGYHTHDSRRSTAGYPDWTIVGPHGVLFRELKRQSGKVSADQQAWLEALRAAGQDACVWRPSHLLNGAVARELARISSLGGRP